MKPRLLPVILLMLALSLFPFRAVGSPTGVSATFESDITLSHSNDLVRIIRIDYGIPHVYADEAEALFFGVGYVTAQDRLWQAELYRRTAAGRLAEVGLGSIQGDAAVRQHGYADAEYDTMWGQLAPDIQAMLSAYIAGINAYVEEAKLDPAHKLPVEFAARGFMPEPWTVRDALKGWVFFMGRRFGERSGTDLAHLSYLQGLTQTYGAERAMQIFDDTRWHSDPDSYASTPLPGSSSHASGFSNASAATSAVADSVQRIQTADDAVKANADALGVPLKLGSNAVIVAPGKSADGTALLLGGPQMGYSIPQIGYEIGIHGAGFDAQGMTFAGVIPLPLIGRTKAHAWTLTVGWSDAMDYVIETLNPDNPLQYLHQGQWRDLEARTEQIKGPNNAVTEYTFYRTVHGAVADYQPAQGRLISLQRAHWLREMDSLPAFVAFSRVHNIQKFGEAVRIIPTNFNVLYIDQQGNIGYWQTGLLPIRPVGADTRLPLKGDGTQEWLGYTNIAESTELINPTQGYVVNWNNMPVAGWDCGDLGWAHGPTHMVHILAQELAGRNKVSWDDMNEIDRIAATTQVEANRLKPLLLQAADRVRATNGALSPDVEQALSLLAAWDSRFVDANLDGKYDAAALTLFESWLARIRQRLFSPVLGNDGGNGGLGVLYRLMANGRAALPVAYDWLGGASMDVIAVDELGQAVQALGASPAFTGKPMPEWLSSQRVTVYGQQGALPAVSHTFLNRGTYTQIVEFGHSGSRSVNVNPPGQSGLVTSAGGPSPHAMDQFHLYPAFQYKVQVFDPLHP